MDKFISYEKLSKKKKRELDRAKRETWNIKPGVRVKESKKLYKRKKIRNTDEGMPDFLISIHCSRGSAAGLR